MSAVGPITIDQAKKLLRAVELYVNDSQNMSTVGDFNHQVVKQELEEGKSATRAVKLLENIRKNDIFNITHLLTEANLTFNQFIALYVYLVREISQIEMLPEIKELMTQALASEDPQELLAKFMENIQDPNREQSIEILYHLVHIALNINTVGFLSPRSDELSTFLGENLTDYFAKVFQFEDNLKLAKLLTNAISHSYSSAFGDSFAEVFGKSLITRKLEKVAMLKSHEAAAAGQFYEMNERLVSATQRLQNLQMLPVKKKRQEKENSRLIGQVLSEVDGLRKDVLLKQRKFETLTQYHQAASSSAGYLMIPADATSSIRPTKVKP